MPEFATPQSSRAATYGSVPASSSGTTITAGSTADTKGSYVELASSTLFDSDWIVVSAGLTGAAGGSTMVDLAIGPATEQVIVPDLYFYPTPSGHCGIYSFPLHIPAGSRLSARCQASVGSQPTSIAVTLCSGVLQGGSSPGIVSQYGSAGSGSRGVDIDPGATANTDSSWVEVTSSTNRAHSWLMAASRFGDGSFSSTREWLLDIAVGAASSEVEIVSDLYFSGSSSADGRPSPNYLLPCSIPIGTRLSARLRSNTVTTGDRTAAVSLYGI